MAEPMEVEPLREIFDQMFALLESLETQNIAVLQFLRDEGIAGDDKLAPYLKRAGNASSVKWRAARARMEHLLTPIPAVKKEAAKQTAETHKPEVTANENKDGGNDGRKSQKDEVKADAKKPEPAERKVERENKDDTTGRKADAAGVESEDRGSPAVDAKPKN